MESPTGAVTALGELLKNKYVASVFAVLCVVAGYIMFNLEDFPKWVKSPCGIVLALAAVASFYTPGARKALVFILLTGTMFTTTACAHLTPYEQRLVDCASPAVSSAVPTLVPQITEQLSGGNPNWNADLGSLLVAGGEAALCALTVSIQQLESSQGVDNVGGAGAGAGNVAASVALARGYAVQASHHYRVKP